MAPGDPVVTSMHMFACAAALLVVGAGAGLALDVHHVALRGARLRGQSPAPADPLDLSSAGDLLRPPAGRLRRRGHDRWVIRRTGDALFGEGPGARRLQASTVGTATTSSVVELLDARLPRARTRHDSRCRSAGWGSNLVRSNACSCTAPSCASLRGEGSWVCEGGLANLDAALTLSMLRKRAGVLDLPALHQRSTHLCRARNDLSGPA
jgi:hypothetical protein